MLTDLKLSKYWTYVDYLADTSKVPYILDEFSYFFETAYDVTKFDNCNLDRPPGSNGDGLMMLVNHFKDIDLFGIFIPGKSIPLSF